MFKIWVECKNNNILFIIFNNKNNISLFLMGYDKEYFKDWYQNNREKISDRQKRYNKQFVEKHGVSRYMYKKLQERNKIMEKNKVYLKEKKNKIITNNSIKKKGYIILYFD